MGCESENAETLRLAGHRVTPQRLLILSILRHGGGHLSAEEIVKQVRQVYPAVTPSTIYRGLSALRQLRLVTETNMGARASSYEWVERQRHHHLICRECGAITTLDQSYVDELAMQILEDHGFEVEADHFAISGLCAACRRALSTAS